MVVARGFTLEALDVAGVQASFRKHRAEPGETLLVGVEARIRNRTRAQERRQLLPVELLSAPDVEHPSAQTADVAGDPCLLTREGLPLDEAKPPPAPGAVRTRAAGRVGKDPTHAVLEVVENARWRTVDEEMAPLGFDAGDLRSREVGRVGDVEREPAVLPQPEVPYRIQAAAAGVSGARVRVGRPRDGRRRANEVEGVGACLRGPRASGRKRNELVDAVAPDIAARHARAATKRGATPAHFPERRELRFDVTHRVDSIAGRIVEIVRLAEGPSPDVHGI